MYQHSPKARIAPQEKKEKKRKSIRQEDKKASLRRCREATRITRRNNKTAKSGNTEEIEHTSPVSILVLGVGRYSAPNCCPIFRDTYSCSIIDILANSNSSFSSFPHTPCPPKESAWFGGEASTNSNEIISGSQRLEFAFIPWFSNGSDSADRTIGSPPPGIKMLLNPDEWLRMRSSWKGAK